MEREKPVLSDPTRFSEGYPLLSQQRQMTPVPPASSIPWENVTQPVASPDDIPFQTEREALQAREKQYYIDHPQSSLELTQTEFMSPYGMPVYKDQHGENHSESTSTFRLPDGRWTTAPMIWPDPQTGKARYFTIDETVGLLRGHGWTNPITGEKIPMFDSEPEASSWAVDRDMTLQDKNLPFNR